MNKRLFLVATTGALALALSACATSTGTSSGADASPASKRASIDSAVDGALANLYTQVPGSSEMISNAKGVLCFPNVISAGLGIGGSYGQGALRVGGTSKGYYSTGGVSFGLIAGGEAKAMYLVFLTQEALDKFQASSGWTAGVDAGVTMINTAADARAGTAAAKSGVVGYVLTKGGLMANLTLDGTKISKLDL